MNYRDTIQSRKCIFSRSYIISSEPTQNIPLLINVKARRAIISHPFVVYASKSLSNGELVENLKILSSLRNLKVYFGNDETKNLEKKDLDENAAVYGYYFSRKGGDKEEMIEVNRGSKFNWTVLVGSMIEKFGVMKFDVVYTPDFGSSQLKIG